jgi:hypothetical protein
LPRLYAARFEFAIQGKCVRTLEAHRSSCPERLIWPILREELLKQDRGVAQLKPVPAICPSGIHWRFIWNPSPST